MGGRRNGKNQAISQKRLKTIQNCFVLRHKYDLKINEISQMVLYENRLNLLDAGIENIIKRSLNSENTCKYFTSEISELSTVLNLSKFVG